LLPSFSRKDALMSSSPPPIDDLGAVVPIPSTVRRVVSLVPSLTESIAATDDSLLVGATDWCTHPGDLDVPRVRGTKNPDLAAIVRLNPDLVVANQEENREYDVARLRAAGVPVWVTRIETLADSFDSLRRLFSVGLGRPDPDWLVEAERRWSPDTGDASTHSVAVPIWRDPWMVVGRSTFTGDLLRRIGLRNVFADAEQRYPHTDPAAIARRDPDIVLLPDEPYRFTAGDGPESFADRPVALVEGRSLTWYGPSLLGARDLLLRQISAALAPPS
jgi:ABC-type Fe3+-hydroxamate transport system substrate-binding protein